MSYRVTIVIASGAKHRTSPTVPKSTSYHLVRPLKNSGLTPGNYILFVGRLVPENCAHHLIDAFRALDTDMKCVIVGDAAYADDYIAGLQSRASDDPRVVFTGYLFGKGLS